MPLRHGGLSDGVPGNSRYCPRFGEPSAAAAISSSTAAGFCGVAQTILAEMGDSELSHWRVRLAKPFRNS